MNLRRDKMRVKMEYDLRGVILQLCPFPYDILPFSQRILARGPRRSGKTTYCKKALDELIKNGYDVALMCRNWREIEDGYSEYNGKPHVILCTENGNLRGRYFDAVILDEVGYTEERENTLQHCLRYSVLSPPLALQVGTI